MKKLFISLATIFVILLAAIIIIPIVFKDDINTAIDAAIGKTVNADVVFDSDDFSISLLKNFPNATAALNNIKVINRAPFEGKTLFAAKKFEIEIDLFSLFGDKITINGLELISPEINIIVLENGTGNYDIAIATGEEESRGTPTKDPANFNIGINHWQISNANLVYEDDTLPVKLEVKNLNHSGNGDFNQDQFDITTLTAIDAMSIIYDGVEYLSNKSVSADLVMAISDNNSRYTFKENKVAVNDFGFGFDGFLFFNKDGSIDMNLSYEAKQTTFKSLLSLVPGIYTDNFNSLETAGNLSFVGKVNGKYNNLTKPAFNLALKVDQAMFKYPDLPATISNISLDLLIDNQDGIIDNTLVNLKQFHMDFGNNPFDAKILVANLLNYELDASVKGNLNLAEISTMIPIEGMSTKGNLSIDLKAQGIYDSLSGQTPKIDAVIKLVNGQVKTAELPYVLNKLNLDAQVKSPTGKMADFIAVINNLSMEMDGEPFAADLEFSNLDNYTWKLNASGGLDLEKITQILPLEDIRLKGKVKANLTTAGNMADLQTKKYHLLTTSGNVALSGFDYTDSKLPYNITISSMAASFDPEKISIDHYEGTIGKSDLAISGSVSNYMAYLFAENQVLKGAISVTSKLINLNEFMSEEVEDDTLSPQKSYGVIAIPKNIDFVMKSKIKAVTLMDMSIADAQGDVIVKDGVVQLSGLNFNLLAGAFAVNGAYDPRDLTKAKYDFNLKIDHLSANKAFETLKVVQTYFPMAKNIDGNMSTDLKLNGLLDESMVPDMNTISGAGSLNIGNATLKNSNALQGIGTFMGNKLLSREQVTIKDILMTFTIKNGLVTVKPFDLNLGGYKSTLSGTSSLSGGLDFDIKMNVPAGQLGSQVNSLVSQYLGGNTPSDTSVIPLNIGIGGTIDGPTFKLKGQPKVADIIKHAVKEQTEEMLGGDVNAKKEEQRQKILSAAQTQADKLTAEAKNLADKVRTEGYAKAGKLMDETSNNPLKRMIAEEAAKKLRKEADNSANKIEREANERVSALLSKAKKEADAIE